MTLDYSLTELSKISARLSAEVEALKAARGHSFKNPNAEPEVN
jgi:hypothetical protein